MLTRRSFGLQAIRGAVASLCALFIAPCRDTAVGVGDTQTVKIAGPPTGGTMIWLTASAKTCIDIRDMGLNARGERLSLFVIERKSAHKRGLIRVTERNVSNPLSMADVSEMKARIATFYENWRTDREAYPSDSFGWPQGYRLRERVQGDRIIVELQLQYIMLDKTYGATA